MTRRKIRTALLAVLLFTGAAWAQDGSGTRVTEDQFVIEARALLQEGRREIIAEELRLDDSEAEAFWSAYEDYHADIMVVRDRYVELIADYLARYDAGELDDKYAKELLDDWLKYKGDKLKVQKQHVRKFSKVLPMRKVVRFYQLENKIDAEIDAELAIFIPLMDPF